MFLAIENLPRARKLAVPSEKIQAVARARKAAKVAAGGLR